MPVETKSDGKGGSSHYFPHATTHSLTINAGLKAAQGPKDTSNIISEQAHAMAHKANPGPVMSDKLGDKKSDKELKDRFEELNKST